MVRRIRRMSGGFKGRLALAVLVIVLLSIAFGLVFWMHFKNKRSEKLYVSRISELEELVNSVQIKEEKVDLENMEPVKGDWVREVEYGFIELSFNISEGDYMDVRIRYPNGGDYLVASNKRLIDMDEEKGGVILEVCEEEILMLSSAEYDLKQYGGTRVYGAICRNAKESAASIVDYVPSQKIMKQLEKNINVHDSALVLNMGLRDELEEELRFYKVDSADFSYYEETEDYKGSLSGLPDQYGGSIWD